VNRQALIERARELAPRLRARTAETEILRRIPDQTVDELRASGLLKIVQPRRFGGLELPYDHMLEVATILSAACGSTGWCFSVWSSHSYMMAMFSEQAQTEYWAGSPDVLSATSSNPAAAKVKRVKGGFELSGRWDFSSGCDASDWAIVGGFADDGLRHFLVPRHDYEIDDTWWVSGLRGTGSKDIVIDGAFVPEHRALPFELARNGESPGRTLHDDVNLRVPMLSLWPFTLAAPLCGMARGALTELEQYTEQRVTMATMQKLSSLATVQLRIGEAAARVRTAERVLEHASREVLDRGRRGDRFSIGDRIGYRLDHAAIARSCVEAVDTMFSVCGAHALFDGSAIQRHHRDVHAASHHAGLAWDTAAREHGRVRVGLPPESPLF